LQVSFGPKQRQLGTDAVGSLSISPKSTIFGIKRLLGKKFSNPQVQGDIKKLPYEVTQGPDDAILINVDYLGERHSFTPEQIVAALIVDMKTIAEVDGSPVSDCVLSVPAYFLESERYAMLDAAQIAGVNCLRLLNDNTASALAYGIYKTDLPETEHVNVAFIDIGHNALQVCPCHLSEQVSPLALIQAGQTPHMYIPLLEKMSIHRMLGARCSCSR
jgi:heat shock protein 4